MTYESDGPIDTLTIHQRAALRRVADVQRWARRWKTAAKENREAFLQAWESYQDLGARMGETIPSPSRHADAATATVIRQLRDDLVVTRRRVRELEGWFREQIELLDEGICSAYDADDRQAEAELKAEQEELRRALAGSQVRAS